MRMRAIPLHSWSREFKIWLSTLSLLLKLLKASKPQCTEITQQDCPYSLAPNCIDFANYSADLSTRCPTVSFDNDYLTAPYANLSVLDSNFIPTKEAKI